MLTPKKIQRNRKLSMSSILITGGTGSLGQALISYLLESSDFSRICVFSRDEWKQAEMAEKFHDSRLRFFIGDVRDQQALENALGDVSVVIHAAALKRVDSVAYNPIEVKKTNIDGTINVIQAAVRAGVKKVIVISSDKAVNAQNIYGASKFMAEQYAVALNAHAWPRGTAVSCIRYGNVLGSRGSVVGVFRGAIEKGQKIRITDPRCTRFWLTLQDAVSYVFQALHWMQGGEIFVPPLRSMRVEDLARAITALCQLEIGGLRPGGEKLHESLICPEEISRTYQFVGHPQLTVLPSPVRWRSDKPWQGGIALPDDFVYCSDKSPFGKWTVEEMRAILKRENLS